MKKYTIVLLVILATQFVQAQTIEQFHQKYYAQLCQRIIECADNVGIAENLMLTKITSKETCVSVFTKMDASEKWLKTINDKTALYHPKAVKSCLTALSKTSCDSIARRVTRPAAVKGCENVITGTIKNFNDCGSHLSCKTNNAVCYGYCQIEQLQCGDNICIGKQFCSQNNTCESLKTVGQSCLNFSECANRNCVDGQCKAKRPVLKKGAACGGENSNICSIGEFCNDTNCVPYKKAGQNCSTKWKEYKQCEALLNCKNNICVLAH